MRAAFYIRRSTDEHQVESLNTQRDSATKYMQGRGWSFSGLEFADDAKSRAEFKKRPGLLAMLAAAKRRDFDVLIVRDEQRLGGDTFRTGVVIQDLLDSGSQLYYYATDERVSFDDPTAKIIVAVRNYASELTRVKIAEQTREHLEKVASEGKNAGGRCYGYDNVPVFVGDKRTHTEYAINVEQAAVIVWIFERYAEGWGLRAICKDLNDRGVPPPRPGKNGQRAFWQLSGVWPMLRRRRYLGEGTYGQTGKHYKGGTRVKFKRPQAEWTVQPMPRIISDELWHRVQVRMEKDKAAMGMRAPGGAPPRYLLSGLATCGVCGGNMKAGNSKQGDRIIKVYQCANHRDKGNAACTNTLRRPVESLDSAVIGVIQETVLSERLLVRTLQTIRQRLKERAGSNDGEIERLEGQIGKLKAEVEKLAGALLTADSSPEILVKMISDREGQVRQLEARLVATRTAPSVLDLETRRMEKEARRWIDDAKAVLAASPAEAKRALAAFLGGEKLVLDPQPGRARGRRYEIQGRICTGGLFPNCCDPKAALAFGQLFESEEFRVEVRAVG